MSWTPKLLLVDDSPAHREILESVFRESHGFEVFSAVNGVHALEILRSLSPEDYPDIIISDVQMPSMTGIELAQEMAKSSRFQDLSIILYSADHSKLGVYSGSRTIAVVSIESVEETTLNRVQALRLLRDAQESSHKFNLNE